MRKPYREEIHVEILEDQMACNADETSDTSTLGKYPYTNKYLIHVRFFTYPEVDRDNPIKFSYNKDIYEYLKRQDLRKLLGKEEKYFNCIFHDDHDRKASIIQKDDGTWIYKCFYEKCKFRIGDITKITECLTKLNRPDALEYMMWMYNIVLEKTEAQQRQEQMLDSNIDMLMDTKDMEKNYPTLYSKIKNCIPQLLILHEYAKRNLTLEDAIRDKYVTFTAPMRKISEALIAEGRSGNLETVSKRTSVLAFLGMVLKLGDGEFTNEELEQAKAYAQSQGFQNYLSLYALPSYSYESLNESETKSLMFKESGMTIGEFTHAMLSQVESPKVVQEVWPRTTENFSKPKEVIVGEEIELQICKLIREKGFCLYSDILKNSAYFFYLRRKFGVVDEFGRNDMNKNFLLKSFKTILPKILQAYGFKKCKAGKAIKEKYKIESTGYPMIILGNK